MDTKISVIIPLYNKELVILDTIKSVLNQTYRNFELLIVDDGSTDKSIKILNDINDSRIRIISQTNEGVSAARNCGIKEAKSEYIFLLDADDIIAPECLVSFVDLINKYKGYSVFVSNFHVRKSDKSKYLYCFGKTEGVIKKPFKALWRHEIFPRTGAMVIKKDCFSEVGYFDTSIAFHEDLEFILRLLKIFQPVFTPVSSLTYILETNNESKKIHPFNKEFAYYANFKNKTFYEKLIIGELIYKSFRKKIKSRDVLAKKQLIKVSIRYFVFVMLVIMLRKIHNNKFVYADKKNY